jgi:hypothetical protein
VPNKALLQRNANARRPCAANFATPVQAARVWMDLEELGCEQEHFTKNVAFLGSLRRYLLLEHPRKKLLDKVFSRDYNRFTEI